MEHLFGLETEFGFAAPGGARDVGLGMDAEWALVAAALRLVPSLADLGAGGGFLANGSRLYVDSGHPELATPEVSNPWDLVRYTLAGERLLEKALAIMWGAARPHPILFKSNVDYLTRNSWGCHESILYRTGTCDLATDLIPHLVSRVVFTGAGGFDALSPGVSFVLSPRALFLRTSHSPSSTDDRGIFHSRDEPLGTGPHKRVHIICGESLCSERAMWLRTATTVLVMAMIGAGVMAGDAVALADPVAALHAIVRDPTCRAEVELLDGRTGTALAMQRHYLDAAEPHLDADFMPVWAGKACELWRAALDDLEGAPDSVATSLDWSIKRALFGRVLARNGLDWTGAARWTVALQDVWASVLPSCPPDLWPDASMLLRPHVDSFGGRQDAMSVLAAHGFNRRGLALFLRARRELFECDIRFGQLGGNGIFAALDRDGVLTHHVPGVEDVAAAIDHPPSGGRAQVRGEAIRRLAADPRDFRCDWTSISSARADAFLDLSDPFTTAEHWRPVVELGRWEGGAVTPAAAAEFLYAPPGHSRPVRHAPYLPGLEP